MVVQVEKELIKNNIFLKGLSDDEIEQVAGLCTSSSYNPGDLCQVENQSTKQIHLITEGKVGVLIYIPSITCIGTEIIMDTLQAGDVFGWQTLIKGTPWATLRVLEPTNTYYINTDALLDLCEQNHHIGYCLMKNLAVLISSRLERNRKSIINTVTAIRSDG